jgi:hypothetical protein
MAIGVFKNAEDVDRLKLQKAKPIEKRAHAMKFVVGAVQFAPSQSVVIVQVFDI